MKINIWFLALLLLCLSGCITVTQRTVFVFKHPAESELSEKDIAEFLSLTDQVAFAHNLVLQMSLDHGRVRRYGRNRNAGKKTPIVFIAVKQKGGESVLQLDISPYTTSPSDASQLQGAFYKALLVHFGSTRVTKVREEVSDPGWLD